MNDNNEIGMQDVKVLYVALGYKKTKRILRALWVAATSIERKTSLRRLQRYLENVHYKGVWR